MNRYPSEEIQTYPIPRTCPFHPPSELDRLRRNDQLSRVRLWSGQEAWVATRFDEARIILTDRRFSSNPKIPGFPLISKSHVALVSQSTSALPQMDPPEHTKLRRILAPYFGQRQAENLRPSVQNIVDRRIDRLLQQSRKTDLVADFAVPVASSVIAILLGLPISDREFFASRTAVRFDRRSVPEEATRAQEDLESYISSLIDLRIHTPGQDLISELVSNYLISGPLSKSEIEVIGTTILQAGHATVANAIPLGVLSLLQDQVQKEALMNGSIPLPNAIEEIFRFHTIGDIGLPRIALQDVQVGSVMVRAGEGVIVSLPAANRDPNRFPDPNQLKLDRDEGVNLTFGIGIHHCIGHDIARMEMEVAVETIFRRMPGLELAVPLNQIQVETKFSLHGIRTLPVTWRAEATQEFASRKGEHHD
jgi:cytochrome P450